MSKRMGGRERGAEGTEGEWAGERIGGRQSREKKVKRKEEQGN